MITNEILNKAADFFYNKMKFNENYVIKESQNDTINELINEGCLQNFEISENKIRKIDFSGYINKGIKTTDKNYL